MEDIQTLVYIVEFGSYGTDVEIDEIAAVTFVERDDWVWQGLFWSRCRLPLAGWRTRSVGNRDRGVPLSRPDYPITVTELLTNMVIRPGGASDPFEAVCYLASCNVGDGGRETGRGNCSRTPPRL